MGFANITILMELLMIVDERITSGHHGRHNRMRRGQLERRQHSDHRGYRGIRRCWLADGEQRLRGGQRRRSEMEQHSVLERQRSELKKRRRSELGQQHGRHGGLVRRRRLVQRGRRERRALGQHGGQRQLGQRGGRRHGGRRHEHGQLGRSWRRLR